MPKSGLRLLFTRGTRLKWQVQLNLTLCLNKQPLLGQLVFKAEEADKVSKVTKSNLVIQESRAQLQEEGIYNKEEQVQLQIS